VPTADVPACPQPTGPAPASKGLPQLSLPCLDGAGDVDLAALRGPLVVNVWASWCPPCREELPALAEVARSAGDQVGFLGVDVVDDATAATALMQQLKLPYPSVFDVQGATRGPLRWIGPPVTYFVAADGRIAGEHRGQVTSAAALRALIEKYLGVSV
jgi:thiol-disulfide isomerase/thioredoxin